MIEYDVEICYHDTSPEAFPCTDYYKCEHCQSVLRRRGCELDHIADFAFIKKESRRT